MTQLPDEPYGPEAGPDAGGGSSIRRRKDEHIDLALAQQGVARPSAFDRYRFEHCALPEIDLDDIDLTTRFLGRTLALPFVISSMTGGPARGAVINANLAEAAEALGVVLAVGSQRVALEDQGDAGLSKDLRRRAPTATLWANLGAAQLRGPDGADVALRAVDMIQADALVVHLNPLQEAIQAGGDRDWRGVLAGISRVVARLERPVIVKEVGYGVSVDVGRRLTEAGVAAVDVAGGGGTAWATIEGERGGGSDRATAAPFQRWGLPTPDLTRALREALPDTPLVASGGVRDGLDAAIAIRLGADLVGQAGPVLSAAMQSVDAVVTHFQVMSRQLRIACLCTGSADLAGLRRAPLTVY